MTDHNLKVNMAVAAIGDLSREELVARWVKAYGVLPPKGIKRGLLERAAAWQLQTKTFGGISVDAKRQLKRATRKLEAGWTVKKRQSVKTGDAALAADAAYVSNGVGGEEARGQFDLISTRSSHRRELKTDAGIVRESSQSARRDFLAPGTQLLREWNGRQHFVEVVDNGFIFDGKSYRSLSAIARRITGAHWSGPRFFGL